MAASLLALIITIIICCNVTAAAPDQPGGGFSVQLIHRDSASSPLYNPNETPTQRLGNALKRSISRLHRFAPKLTSSLPYSDVTASNGEYLMNISIGTPPFPILAVADTGSDVVWTQCKPCSSCYDQDAPIFDPAASSSYKTVPCSSNACSSLQAEGAYCSSTDAVCHYKVGYGDRSHTYGDLALDTLTMGSTAGRDVAFPKTLIGCGHDNAGTFNRNGSGLVGLGRGSASLVTQLGSSIGGKFSYCLVPFGSDNGLTSSMNFGQNAVVSGAVSTPLFSHVSQPTFYFLKLEAVIVGKERLAFGGSSVVDGEQGNIIIDSGTTVTLVPSDFFAQLSDAVDSQVVGGEKARDPQDFLSLCYVADYSRLQVPPITFNFQGADVELTRDNAFVQVSDTVTCLAFYGSDDASIYGNVAQQNFLIGYDLQKGTVSFKPTDCATN
ncbi:unnamed protein product [Linum tenue]|uniref:Peptidase A1 domain-containing protein n=1 Tax=Linum tenue TaxID=586396 RepID=A0AAV0LIY7_9ROSI|nr:unnamed protein product [Linum tenue]